jgi:phosphohistidine phosphatase
VTEGAGRRLILLRHAKSAWPDVPDRDRPLAGRGRRQAPLAGAWLASAGHHPDLVLCSPARRTRDTWKLVAAELGTAGEVRYEEQVYGASAAALLDLVRETPPSVLALLLVGHSPGLPDLAVDLAGGRPGAGAGEALRRLTAKFPTAAVAVLEVPGAWQDLAGGGARLVSFVVPRDLER